MALLATLPILNPEIHTTRRMERWLRGRATVRRLLRAELYLDDPHCAYCRRPLASPDRAVLDHATPRSQGGSDQPSNAMLSCWQCDKAKGNRTISEWKADLLAGLFSIGRSQQGQGMQTQWPVLKALITCESARQNEDETWTLAGVTSHFKIPTEPSPESPLVHTVGVYIELFARDFQERDTVFLTVSAGVEEKGKAEIPCEFTGEPSQVATIGGDIKVKCTSCGQSELGIFWGNRLLGKFPFGTSVASPG